MTLMKLNPKTKWAATWVTTSFTEPGKEYEVGVASTGLWACACLAYRFARAPKVDCKHIKKVRGVEEVPVASGVPTQVQVNNRAALHKGVKGTIAQPVLAVQTPKMLIIQTRREICLEEEY